MRKILRILYITCFLLLCSAPLCASLPEGAVPFAQWVTNPFVAGVLIAIGLSCAFIELATASFGIFGILSLVSFFLFFACHLVLDSFAWLALIIFVVGMALLMLEAFVLTGFGFSGLMGILAVFGSVLLLAPDIKTGALTLLVTVVLTILILVVSLRYMKKTNFIHKFILKDRTDSESGYTAPNMDNEKYIGREGVTLTPLRPAGAIKLDGNRVDVVSEGDFLAVGVKVRVIGIDGTRIIVRAVEE